MMLPSTILTHKKQIIVKKYTKGNLTLTVEISHDDSLNNGHNSFHITGDIHDGRRWLAGGMLHDEISRFTDEFDDLFKWHGCTTEGPMHYLANTMWHSSSKDCWGHEKGEPCNFETVIQFLDFPLSYYPDYRRVTSSFIKFLQDMEFNYDLEIIEVQHKDEGGHKYSPKYTLGDFGGGEWYRCPFDSMAEAEEFLDQIQGHRHHFISKPTGVGEGKEPDLEAARSCAIWPDATLEQLQDKDALEKRLPKLMLQFKTMVLGLGLSY